MDFDSLPHAALLRRITSLLPAGAQVYLVGGALRDMLLGRATHDLDFVVISPPHAIQIARRVANGLGEAFYPLDTERDTGRVVIETPTSGRLMLDFAAPRRPTLEADLRMRDFTINAIAVPLDPAAAQFYDPLDGISDLRNQRLRACSPEAFNDDPLRIVRGVRMATALKFPFSPETKTWMKASAHLLGQASPERQRDELFRILDGPRCASALRALDIFGTLEILLPELKPMQGIEQSPPHTLDVYEHTLSVASRLSDLLDLLGEEHNPETAAKWALGMVVVRLGRFRQQLKEHLATRLNPGRSLRALLILSALYHDCAKPLTRQVDEAGRTRFFDHEVQGARVAEGRALAFHLSNSEIERLATIVRGHMRPLQLAWSDEGPTRRAVYRFFRSNGPAGVDICLLSLADTLGTYGPTLPEALWIKQVECVRILLEAWCQERDVRLQPPTLLNGDDLIEAFHLTPGPLIGQLLEHVREAQAVGEIETREEALADARAWIEKQN